MDNTTYFLLIVDLLVGAPMLHFLYSYVIGILCRFVIAKTIRGYQTQIYVFAGATTILFWVGAAGQVAGGYIAPMYWGNKLHMSTGEAIALLVVMFFGLPFIIHGVGFGLVIRSENRSKISC